MPCRRRSRHDRPDHDVLHHRGRDAHSVALWWPRRERRAGGSAMTRAACRMEASRAGSSRAWTVGAPPGTRGVRCRSGAPPDTTSHGGSTCGRGPAPAPPTPLAPSRWRVLGGLLRGVERDPAFGGSSNVSGSGACPYRSASTAHRSRHATGVDGGTSGARPRATPVTTSAAPPGTRRSRRHPSPASGRRPNGAQPHRRSAPPRPSRSSSCAGAQGDRRRASPLRAATPRRPAGTRPRARAQSADRFEPCPLAGPGLQRHVDRGPGRPPLPDLVREPRPGKQERPVSWIEKVSTPGSS